MTKQEYYDLYLDECAKHILMKDANEQILRTLEDQLNIPIQFIDDFRRSVFNNHYAIQRYLTLVPQGLLEPMSHFQERISDALDKVISMP